MKRSRIGKRTKMCPRLSLQFATATISLATRIPWSGKIIIDETACYTIVQIQSTSTFYWFHY
jgi:hypothetical protein